MEREGGRFAGDCRLKRMAWTVKPGEVLSPGALCCGDKFVLGDQHRALGCVRLTCEGRFLERRLADAGAVAALLCRKSTRT